MPKSQFLTKLVRNKFQSDDKLRQLFDNERRHRTRRRKTQPRVIKGVVNGQFVRIRVPEKKPILPSIPKLPQTIKEPKPFTPTTQSAKLQRAMLINEERRERARDFFDEFQAWWKENWAVLILNLGSVCSLIGFTRSDVVELRALSAMGSMGAVVYNASFTPTRYSPILWSLSFAGLNMFKIFEVINERKGNFSMTDEQEMIYSKFFLSHGVTPKQFETLYKRAEIVHIKQGQHIVEEGEELHHVMLVVHGETRAQLGLRRLTAASFKHEEDAPEDDRLAWTSGAWCGEIAFLEKYWNREQQKLTPKATKLVEAKPEAAEQYAETYDTSVHSSASATETKVSGMDDTSQAKDAPVTRRSARRVRNLDATNDGAEAKAALPRKRSSGKRRAALNRSSAMSSGRSMYTIVAREDTVLMRWKHQDMEDIMATSIDMRGALTRAMTAAIVGKVINFTVSRRSTSKQDAWTSWLGAGFGQEASSQVKVEKPTEKSPRQQEESPAGGPVKKFGSG